MTPGTATAQCQYRRAGDDWAGDVEGARFIGSDHTDEPMSRRNPRNEEEA